jgi:molybdopterin-binding protein
MTDQQYRPGEVAELLGVSVDTVRRLADRGELPTTRTGDGRRVIAGEDLAAYLAGQAEPVGSGPVVGGSARNRFAGIVTRVVVDGVVATVELRSGRHRIVSLLTAEAVEELDLRPGVRAVAAVKATNVVVEVPRR